MEKRITKRIKDKATKSMHTVGTVKDFEEDCILFNGEWIEKLNGIKVRVIFGKNIEKSACAVMIRIIITFGNQIFL